MGVNFTTSKGSHNEWENELYEDNEARPMGAGPEGEGGERSSSPAASDVVKLLCGETVCHFQVKKYYYLPEDSTNKDSKQSCHTNGLYLRKFSGVDPNWLTGDSSSMPLYQAML